MSDAGTFLAAAKAMLDKMTTAMIGQIKEDDDAQKKQITDLYGKDDVDSAGQVGKNYDAILGVLKEGNLRERMTALYNAMFGQFKTYVTSAIKWGRWSQVKDKGLNVTKLQRRKRQLIFNPTARDVYRNPYLKYDRKNVDTYEDFGPNMRKEVKKTSERTVGELEAGGTGLSQREKDLQFNDKQGEDISNEKLKWREGKTNWELNDKNPWVKNAKESLKMPVVAGPSGTMTRMLQLWEWLSKPAEGVDWRLAVLAWMLTSQDHTFHEMMQAAVDYGFPYTAGRESYMNVAPLTVWELREKVAKNNLFPHELAFQRDFDSGKMDVIMDSDAIDDAADELDDLDAKHVGGLSPQAAAAIQLYTSFGYLILNPILRGGPQAESMIVKAIQEKSELSHFKDDYERGKLDVSKIIEQGRRIIPMLVSSLEMLPDWSGHLYRGTASDSRFAFMGKSFRFDKVGSATDDVDVAKDFADNFNTGKFKYILELDVTAGKDLREISSTANESEVVLPPGSSFTITKRVWPTKDEPYFHVFMKQTGRGGAKLDLGVRPEVPKDEEDETGLSSSDESESGPGLAVFDRKNDDTPALTFHEDDIDYLDETVNFGDGWMMISDLRSGSGYYVQVDAWHNFIHPKPQVTTPPPPQPKKTVKLHLAPDEDIMGFDFSTPSEVIKHEAYAMAPGWTMVTLRDDDGTIQMFGKTDAFNAFMGLSSTPSHTAPTSGTPTTKSDKDGSKSEDQGVDIDDLLDEIDQQQESPTTPTLPKLPKPTAVLPFDVHEGLVSLFEYDEWDMLDTMFGISAETLKDLDDPQLTVLAAQLGMDEEKLKSKIGSL